MCELYPRYGSCCGIPIRIALIFIAVLSIVTGALINAVLKKAGIDPSSVHAQIEKLKNATLNDFKFEETYDDDELALESPTTEFIDTTYEDVETTTRKRRRPRSRRTSTYEPYSTVEIIGEDGQREIIRFTNDDDEDPSYDQEQRPQLHRNRRFKADPDPSSEDTTTESSEEDHEEETVLPFQGAVQGKGSQPPPPPPGGGKPPEKPKDGGKPPPKPPGGGAPPPGGGGGAPNPPGGGGAPPPGGGGGATNPPGGGGGAPNPPGGGGGAPNPPGGGGGAPNPPGGGGGGPNPPGGGGGLPTPPGGGGGGPNPPGGGGEPPTPPGGGGGLPTPPGGGGGLPTPPEGGGPTPPGGGGTTTTAAGASTKKGSNKGKESKKEKEAEKEKPATLSVQYMGAINTTGINFLGLLFIALGILLLFANLMNSPDLMFLYVILCVSKSIVMLALLISVLVQCSRAHERCLMRKLDWFTSFSVTIFWFLYTFVWGFFAAVANGYANSGWGNAL